MPEVVRMKGRPKNKEIREVKSSLFPFRAKILKALKETGDH